MFTYVFLFVFSFCNFLDKNSSGDQIILPTIRDCETFSFEFVKIWSNNVEVFAVILVASLI